MSTFRDEVADLIVMGRCREAYDMLASYRRLESFEARRNVVEARNVIPSGPMPNEAEIDAKHDRMWAELANDCRNAQARERCGL